MTTLITMTVVALVLGAACLFVYDKVHNDIPRRQRLRLLMFLMTFFFMFFIAMVTMKNPLPGYIPLLLGFLAAWGGPSG